MSFIKSKKKDFEGFVSNESQEMYIERLTRKATVDTNNAAHAFSSQGNAYPNPYNVAELIIENFGLVNLGPKLSDEEYNTNLKDYHRKINSLRNTYNNMKSQSARKNPQQFETHLNLVCHIVSTV